ncbi:interleukin-18 receptor accessory protein-like isoform X2 [Xiphias gladius]|uniref:interleukin-18 receptor accessory protein-like isoform X2 n=1 Tax=Xiphias gladius TaxID=8245 RepID=UPI001A9941FE|nr:interleukin-18 receptor accessory protein-like isoform X2 [Xiphias gladius]
MQTGYILVCLIFPIVLDGCCMGNHQNKRPATAGLIGLRQDTTHQHYRAVEGESFMMPCVKSTNRRINVVWSRTGDGRGGNEGPSFDCGKEFPAEVKHSGNYTCLTGGSKLYLHLQVVKNISLRCFRPEENKVELLNSAGGKVPCPGRNCSNNTDVRWYKGNIAVSEQRRDSCERNGLLHLCQVKSEFDPGVYFCDRQIIEQGVTWTFRRAVKVKVVPHKTTSNHPRIVYPAGNMTEEVELGWSHTLTCEVFFPYENKISADVRWYINYSGNKESMTQLHMERPQQRSEINGEYRVTRRAIIKEVTPQHLNHTYTCIANNTVGNSSVTIKLKKKIEDDKEFDVFLSYLSPQSAEVEGGWPLFSQSGPDTDKEACLSSTDPLNTKECGAIQRPLEVLLPQVLEEQWGYRLCLLERDMLPGGAYTNDVILAIQRSQMLICLLSADYLCNSNAVFVLESGVQALLQNSVLKLLLIWTSGDPASLIQQDPPLPSVVQRALKVLPSLNWTSGKPARATCNFWRSLRKAMPDRRVKLVSLMQDQ